MIDKNKAKEAIKKMEKSKLIQKDPFRWIDDIREAVLDLSGHSFRVGIRIKLF